MNLAQPLGPGPNVAQRTNPIQKRMPGPKTVLANGAMRKTTKVTLIIPEHSSTPQVPDAAGMTTNGFKQSQDKDKRREKERE